MTNKMILHDGKGMPEDITPDMLVVLCLRNEKERIVFARDWDWEHEDVKYPDDIIKYRPYKSPRELELEQVFTAAKEALEYYKQQKSRLRKIEKIIDNFAKRL